MRVRRWGQTEAPSGSDRRDGPVRGLVGTAALGAAGSALLALASDLPASPFGPHAAGLWPFTVSGVAPGWEGPAVPGWAGPANRGAGVPSGQMLVLAAAVVGVVLLWVAWLRLWRAARADPGLQFRGCWWVVGAWIAPLLLAAPFATQDAWLYAAQGKLVASGYGAMSPPHLLGHSVWVSGVDPRYLKGPSLYGPGALDLSALFAMISGGHPWIAVECWRVAVVASLGLCAWGVARVAAARGIEPVEAVVAGVANPGVLILLVAGIHNDAVMIGLIVVGVALALTKRPWWALCLAALAVTVKAPAALAVFAIAWWCWNGAWSRRAASVVAAMALTVVALAVTGLGVGGGFGWLRSASVGTVASSFSVLHLEGITASGPVNALQLAGIVAGVIIVLSARRRGNWVGALALGFAVIALSAANPQPWYVLWALPILACAAGDAKTRRAGVLVLCAMACCSVLPLGALVWFVGIFYLVGIWLMSRREWQLGPKSNALPTLSAVPE